MLRRMLATADVLAAGLASLVVGGVSHRVEWSLLYLPVWVVLAKVQGLYDRDQRSLRHLTIDELSRLLIWAASGSAGLALVLSAAPAPAKGLGLESTVRMAFLVAGFVFVFRVAARAVWRRITPPEQTVILGKGPLAEAARRKLELFPDIHVFVIEERELLDHEDVAHHAAWPDGLDRVIVASPDVSEKLIKKLVAFCRGEHIKLSVVPPVRGMFGTAVQLNHVADLPVVEYNTWDVSRSTIFLKRLIDLIVCVILLPLMLPVFVLIAVGIKLETPGPVIYSQWRAGLNGRPFQMYKFRTMVSNAEELLQDLVDLDHLSDPVFKLPRDPRVTRVGRFLRRWSLDELPQLINVLGSAMSLVGPRPEQVELVARYLPEHRFRLAVKPGLTGPMQVNGRAALGFEERLAIEREYIENLTLGRDLRILALTASAVVRGSGAF